ncbi:hypothetical protein BDV18DRAFT_160962 [Aspergillus unguis]
MEPDANDILDYPGHWKATLLGEDFWKDAEVWNKNTNDEIEADHDQSLHTRFPFNIGPDEGPTQIQRVPSITITAADPDDEEVVSAPPALETGKRSRRFSMNDAFSLNSLAGRSNTSLFSGSRVLELGRHSRSRSRPNNSVRSSSITADFRRSNSMIRSTFNRFVKKKVVDEVDEEVEKGGEEQDDGAAIETEDPIPVLPMYGPDQATPMNPLIEFRGGVLWTALPKDRQTLGLDVFWPIPVDKSHANNNGDKEYKLQYRVTGEKQSQPPSEENGNEENELSEDDEEQPPIFHIDNMAPLCMFRNLRVLKITGMMQSYQMYIFQAAWLNPHLEELEIGMALPPRLSRRYKWPYIKGGWRLNKATYGEPVYHGTGDGSLLRTVGVAEYLDKVCLEKAKIRAMAMGATRNRLSIRTLILTSVVVDADPFLHWFDPKRLKCINFKDNCVDAGFYLTHCMRKVSVLFPRQLREPVNTVEIRKVDPRRELKIIEIKGGRKIGEIPYRGKESLEEEIPRNAGPKASSADADRLVQVGKEGHQGERDKKDCHIGVAI